MTKHPNTLIPQEDPTTIGILLTQGQIAIIDIEDLTLVAQHRWRADFSRTTKSFYAKANLHKPDDRWTQLQMHRLIMHAQKGQEVDHIFHLTLDNRKSELRLCTKNQNQHNRGKQANNTGGFKGVSWDKRDQKWKAYITMNGKQKTVGRYDTPELANSACITAREDLHGEFARDV
jgi:hypothetical protein